MATLEDLKIQIENANALGRTNLFENGVELPETATTYKIMQNIKKISSVDASLNIAYGETAPADTSKLWIKANKPANVSVDSNLNIIEKIVTSNTHLPTSNSDMGYVAIGTKIYLFGGSGIGSTQAICVFDTKTETITTLSTTLPIGHKSMGCAAVGTKIYLLGGYGGEASSTYLKTIYVFDTETEIITTLSATLPAVCCNMGCVAIGTKIYLFGGNSTFGDSLNTINVFDTTTETISTLSTTLPTACKNMGCTSIGTKIYLFGGRGKERLNTIYVFDTETETIRTLSTTLPTAYEMMGCASIGTKIYLFGGFGGNSGNQINIFDTETETVTTSLTKLSSECISMGCVSVNNKIYLFGGKIGYNSNMRLDTISICYIAHQLAQGNIKIQSGSLTNKFNLINTKNTQIRIGVENVFIGNENNEAETANAFLFIDGEWKQIF